ncbi:MAG TPA: hypothetical protein VJI96_04945 [Candidatus Andersenbacteria bacterium]|nr:hypothetical protein [Candidatus Andersenbacteria bacterium]
MPGITRGTALEIFTNPNDLEFTVGERTGKWAILITRGPGHNFKMLLSSEPVLPSKAEAITGISNLLKTILHICGNEMTNPATLAAQMLNPDNKSLEEAAVLTPAMQTRIIEELQQKNTSSTYSWMIKVVVMK